MIHVAFFENIAHAHAYLMNLQILVAQMGPLPYDKILWGCGSGILRDSSARSVPTPSRCITGSPPQHATVPAVATPPLHCRLRHWCVHPRLVSARPSLSTQSAWGPPATPCGGEDTSHRTQLPSCGHILLPFTPNTRGTITYGVRATWISCLGLALPRHLTFGVGGVVYGRRRSAW